MSILKLFEEVLSECFLVFQGVGFVEAQSVLGRVPAAQERANEGDLAVREEGKRRTFGTQLAKAAQAIEKLPPAAANRAGETADGGSCQGGCA